MHILYGNTYIESISIGLHWECYKLPCAYLYTMIIINTAKCLRFTHTHVQQVIGSRDLQLLVTITHVIVCTHTLKSTKNMGQSVQLMSARVESSGNGCPPVA